MIPRGLGSWFVLFCVWIFGLDGKWNGSERMGLYEMVAVELVWADCSRVVCYIGRSKKALVDI